MSMFGFHIGQGPTGLDDVLRNCAAAGSPVPLLMALNQNIAHSRNEYSPKTALIYRDQSLGPDNGAMYQGTVEEAHLAGHAWAAQLIPLWRQNPADRRCLINEPGRNDPTSLRWLVAFCMGAMDEAQANGMQIGIPDWSTGMPPINAANSRKIVDYLQRVRHTRPSSMTGRAVRQLDTLERYHLTALESQEDYIAIYLPMLRQARANGHWLTLHEYSLAGPMIGSPLCLRYRDLYAQLPTDAQPYLALTEIGPDAGYGLDYFGQAYVDVVGAYDIEVIKDARFVIGFAAFKWGAGESNLGEAVPLIQPWIINHPTPVVELPPDVDPLAERVAVLETDSRANLVSHQAYVLEHAAFSAELAEINARLAALETNPPPAAITASLNVYPTAIQAGQTVALDWTTTNAQAATLAPFGGVPLAGSVTHQPTGTTEYVLVASAPGLTPVTVRRSVAVTAPPPTPIYRWFGVGVGSNQPLTPAVISAYDTARTACNAVKLFTMPDADLMRLAIAQIRGKRPDVEIMARLFFSVNPGVKFTAAEFVAFCSAGLQAAYGAGVRYFEIHNEPNLYDEGDTWNWNGGAGFGQWLRDVLAIVKPLFPGAKWGYPGLSPQPNLPQFLIDSAAAIDQCDWVGAHAYFQHGGTGTFGMQSPDGGLAWRAVRDRARGKPVLITEFSCNTANVGYADKGVLYAEYNRLLSTETGLLGALAFALEWPGSDVRREGWVYGNKVTPLPGSLAVAFNLA